MVPQSEEDFFGSYMNCVCAEGATCHRVMHKEGVPCDRTVYLTKNSRHRICKGCRSEKRKRPDGEGAGGTQVRDSSGRGSRIEEDEEEEEEVVEEEEKREEKEKNKSKEADHSIDLLHLLAAHASTRVSARVRASVEEQAREKARAVVPPPAPAPAPAPAPKVVYNAPYNRRPPQGARPRGRPRKVTTETNDQNFYYASASTSATSATANAANVAKRLKVEVVGSGGGGTKKYPLIPHGMSVNAQGMLAAGTSAAAATAAAAAAGVDPTTITSPITTDKDGKRLTTRNGDEVQLLACVCVKGGQCHRTAHLSGQPCDSVCRISKSVRHRVCKACRSGGKKKVVPGAMHVPAPAPIVHVSNRGGTRGSTQSLNNQRSTLSAGGSMMSLQNPRNMAIVKDSYGCDVVVEGDEAYDFSLRDASQVVAMFANAEDDVTPRTMQLQQQQGQPQPLKLEQPHGDDINSSPGHGTDTAEVALLADVEIRPSGGGRGHGTRGRTRNQSIVMLRQPECLEDPSNTTFMDLEKKLLSKVEGGPITYSNVNTPREHPNAKVEGDDNASEKGGSGPNAGPCSSSSRGSKNENEAQIAAAQEAAALAHQAQRDAMEAMAENTSPRTSAAMNEAALLLLG